MEKSGVISVFVLEQLRPLLLAWIFVTYYSYAVHFNGKRH
jgi:hypothetical protein